MRACLLGFSLCVVLVVALFQGFATHTVGSLTEPGGSSSAPLAHADAILRVRGSRLVSAERPPGRRIALTFDDGPGPWTAPISRELHRLGVPATFMEIGSQIPRYPGSVRQLLRYGDEIGNHTFTHVLLPTIPKWEAQLEVNLTEAAIVGATGHSTRLLRPPYSAEPDAITSADERSYVNDLGHGYYIVVSDFDSEDWTRPGVRTIVHNATPPGHRGGIVLMHDGGGNRAETLRALPILVHRLRSRGYRFVTVSRLAGVSRAAVMPVASRWSQTRARIFLISARAAFVLTDVTAVLLLVVVGLVVLRALLLFGFASYDRVLRRRARAAPPQPNPEYLPSAAIIVPAFNEEVGIERTLRSLAASDYPDFEIVVVDDGSTDRTVEIVKGLDLPNMRLVQQDNAGKAAALQRGVDLTDTEVVAMVDGDTQFESQTLRRLVHPFRNQEVGAVSGNTKVGNRRGLIGRWQHIEYVIGFNLDRRMYHVLRCMPTIPGAIGAFRRDVLDEVGGVPAGTIAEDTDLTLAIGRAGRRIVYVEDARAWTEAPSTLRGLWQQRYRWSFGTMQAVWKHRRALFSWRSRERRIGWITIPYVALFYVLLPLLAPLIDLFAIYGLLFLGWQETLIVWGGFNLIAMATAAYALWLDHERLRSVWAVPVQQFVYRQLMYLVIIESFSGALEGRSSGWRHVRRTGDAVVGAS